MSISLLLAVAGGAAGAMGEQLWQALCSLVRRHPHQTGSALVDEDTGPEPPELAVYDGERELTALSHNPLDRAAAQALAEGLRVLADSDPDFRAQLGAWHTRALQLYPNVNTGGTYVISGGVFHQPVIQAENATVTFNSPAPQPPPAPEDPDDRAPRGRG
ncbi:hypothetical protein KDL01_26250 [Actinospica durhamensis]|uniref:Uncharacterized protein n=1 Tax=Actinospica durhamensis TaxID=1508375 RepID=A0A941EQW5_9ACTN|nr:hypothetical protein [Actinospica durhamensis]MBR7836810.1 hypothetical protein [Actinospica durhamensis]